MTEFKSMIFQENICQGAPDTYMEDYQIIDHYEDLLSDRMEDISRLHIHFKSDEFKKFTKDFRIVSHIKHSGRKHIYESSQQTDIANIFATKNRHLCQDSRDVWVLYRNRELHNIINLAYPTLFRQKYY